MPMTEWQEAKGATCALCQGPATHYYGDIWICCDCHVGVPGGGLFTREEAEKIHRGEDPFEGKRPPGPSMIGGAGPDAFFVEIF
jgi:hypothetical protein